MKYATFNESGEIAGRYDTNVHSNIPNDAIELPDKLWFSTLKETDGIWQMVNGELIKQPFPKPVTDYSGLIAAERFVREASGVIVEGMKIETTRDSQALIASTGLSAILDPEYHCNFKTLDGFVEIGAEQIIAIAKAVRAHVQACFDRELTLLRALEAGTYKEEMLDEGWPDSSQPSTIATLQ